MTFTIEVLQRMFSFEILRSLEHLQQGPTNSGICAKKQSSSDQRTDGCGQIESSRAQRKKAIFFAAARVECCYCCCCSCCCSSTSSFAVVVAVAVVVVLFLLLSCCCCSSVDVDVRMIDNTGRKKYDMLLCISM
jgi:hypothetical protein